MPPNRPSSAIKWPDRLGPIKIPISENNTLEYNPPDNIGQFQAAAFSGKSGIVIRGKKDNKNDNKRRNQMESKYCFHPYVGYEKVEFPHIQPKLEAGCRVHVPVFGIHIWGGDTGYCPHCAMLGRGGINTADMGFELQHPNGRIDEICEEYAAVLMLQGISIIWGYMFE